MAEHFDLVIIGSGPAGLSSALYASRGKLKTLVLEKGQNGGQAAITHWGCMPPMAICRSSSCLIPPTAARMNMAATSPARFNELRPEKGLAHA